MIATAFSSREPVFVAWPGILRMYWAFAAESGGAAAARPTMSIRVGAPLHSCRACERPRLGTRMERLPSTFIFFWTTVDRRKIGMLSAIFEKPIILV